MPEPLMATAGPALPPWLDGTMDGDDVRSEPAELGTAQRPPEDAKRAFLDHIASLVADSIKSSIS
jgi:hypothetical protein